MSLRFLCCSAVITLFSAMQPPTLDAQPRGSDDTESAFSAFDLNEDGRLSGRELTVCRCGGYDVNRDNEVTAVEFRSGWARAPLFGGNGSQRDGNAPVTPPTATTPGRYQVADRVQVNVGGTWYSATVVQVQSKQYRLSRDDRAFGVTTSDEWIAEDRLRPFVDKPTAAAPAANLPTSVPTGTYSCTTYQTGGGTNVGELHILAANMSSGVTRDGSGPQHKFTYNAGNGAISWVGGLQIVGFAVERAEYRPELNGTPNINLHYRRQAGGNLNSMSCRRR